MCLTVGRYANWLIVAYSRTPKLILLYLEYDRCHKGSLYKLYRIVNKEKRAEYYLYMPKVNKHMISTLISLSFWLQDEIYLTDADWGMGCIDQLQWGKFEEASIKEMNWSWS